jgi:hypothetical protein
MILMNPLQYTLPSKEFHFLDSQKYMQFLENPVFVKVFTMFCNKVIWQLHASLCVSFVMGIPTP